MTRVLAVMFISIFILTAVFGLYFPLMPMSGHDAGCPFALGASLCGQPLAHLTHWQDTFVSIVLELLVLAAIVLVATWGVRLPRRIGGIERYRQSTPDRPTLFELLFADGILHPRIP